MKLFTYIFIFIAFQTSILAQAGIYTEDDIKEQSDFISALSLMFDEDYADAIEKLDGLLEIAPNNAVLYAERAEAYAHWQKLDKAYADIQKAIRFDAQKISFYQTKFDIESALGEYQNQIQTCQKLVELEPRNIHNYYDLYNSYRGAGQDGKAMEQLNKIVDIFGINERVTNSKIGLYKKVNDQKGITKSLEELIAVYPYDVEYQHKLAQHFKIIGEQEKATEINKGILVLDPDDQTAMNEIKRSSTKQNSNDPSKGSMLELVSNTEVSINNKILELIPYIQNMSSDIEDEQNVKLDKVIKKLKELHPNEAKAYSISGDFYFNSAQTQMAIKDYKKTIQLHDSVFDVWTQLLTALYFENKYADLKNYAEQTVDLFPNKVDGYYFSALAYAYLGNSEEANAYTSEAIFIAGKNKYWVQKLKSVKAHLSFADNRFEEAIANLDLLEPFSEQDAVTAKLHGDSMSKTGQKKKAVNFWKLAVKLGYNTSLLKEQIYAAGS